MSEKHAKQEFTSRDGQFGYVKDQEQNVWRKVRLTTGEEVGKITIPQSSKDKGGKVHGSQTVYDHTTHKPVGCLPAANKGIIEDCKIDAYGGMNWCGHDGKKLVWESDGKQFFCGGYGASARSAEYDIVLDLADVVRNPSWGKPGRDVIRPLSPKPYLDLNHLQLKDDYTTPKWSKTDPFVPQARYPNVVSFRWPDGRVIPMNAQFWEDLWELLPGAPGKPGRTLICCMGGHGRTGTCLAALMMASGQAEVASSLIAVLMTRSLHCEQAVESAPQLLYLDQLASEWELGGGALLANRIPYGQSGAELKRLAAIAAKEA